MATKYQKGTVYECGKRVKMWYGKYLTYTRDVEGKEIRRQRNIRICSSAYVTKLGAEEMLERIINKESRLFDSTPSPVAEVAMTFGWFVRTHYIPMRRGRWSPAYTKTNTYQLEHYLISHFGDLPIRNLGTFEMQIWLNNLAERGYSQTVVLKCFSNMRAITRLARKLRFLEEDPGEDLIMPLTDPAEKPVMTPQQILGLLKAIEDLHDLSLMYIAIFCGLRAGEAVALQWKSWTGTTLLPYGTAYEGQFYKERFKTKSSRNPIPVPEQVKPVIDLWQRVCKDPSPEALMFPTFGRGDRKGEAIPRDAKNFLNCRIRPIARKLGIPDHLITFQVMRRTMGTDMQHYGTLKDTQGALRHASIRTTGDIYIQTVDENVARAINARANAVLSGWKAPIENLALNGRNLRNLSLRRQQLSSEQTR